MRDAFGHLKIIGHVAAADRLLDLAGVDAGDGIVPIESADDTAAFIKKAKSQRIWEREPSLRSPG